MATVRLHHEMPVRDARRVLKLARLIAQAQDRYLEAPNGSDVESRLVDHLGELDIQLALACRDISLLKKGSR